MARSDSERPADARAVGRLEAGLAVVLTLGSVAWAADLYRAVGLVLYTGQFLMGMLAVTLPLIYVRYRWRGGKGSGRPVPWYDWAAAVAGFAFGAYAAVRYPELSEELTFRPLDGVVTGAVLILLSIEGLRRTAGPVLVLVVLVFLLYAGLGDQIPGVLEGRPIKAEKLLYYLAWDVGALPGTPMRIATTIVISFVLFGAFLSKSGGTGFFTDISMVLMGRYRGGSAKIAITASGLFGSISGSAVSNVVSTGVITIPMMRQGGYAPHVAGAIEAVASTGGQLMPPIMGAAAFLMATILEIPYTEVVLAALIPAVLYYVALFFQADLEAARSGIARVDESRIPAALVVLRSGWFFPLPFVVLIGALFWLNLTPERSALWGAIVLLVCGLAIGYRGRRMRAPDILDGLRETGFAVLDIMMITAAAGLIIGVLNVSGLGFGLTLALVQLAGGNLLLLLVLAAVVCIILGLGMPTLGVYVLLAALVAPALVELGVNEMAAHLFVMYYGMMSMITPPVAIAAFAAANLARTDAMLTGFTAVRFGWLAYIIPFLFVLSPNLLMIGETVDVIVAFVTAVAGIWLMSVAVAGYFARPIGGWERAGFGAAGLMLLFPAGAFDGAVAIDLAGLALGVALVGREFVVARRVRRVGA